MKEEIHEFLISKMPLILDLESGDLRYDTRNMYYKILKYIKELEKRK